MLRYVTKDIEASESSRDSVKYSVEDCELQIILIFM